MRSRPAAPGFGGCCRQIFGYGVPGDRVYGGPKIMRINDLQLTRQMLHAESLSLFHPVTGTPLTFIAPTPQDMQEIVKNLRTLRTAEAE